MYSNREQEILDLLLAGESYKSISERFGISRHTVKAYEMRILRRAKAKNGEYNRLTGIRLEK